MSKISIKALVPRPAVPAPHTLSHVIHTIINHGFQQGQCFFDTSTSAGNAKSHSSTISDMRIVALRQQGHQAGTLLWGSANVNHEELG